MGRYLSLLLFVFFLASASAQPQWSIPKRTQEIQLDGLLGDWTSVPRLEIVPGGQDIRLSGTFEGQADLQVTLRSVWDEDSLYFAVTWADNSWDIEEVTRRDAVWVDPEKKRRDRMLFFDYLKLHIRESDYDYTLWMSPRSEDIGPFFWARLLEGFRGTERATAIPVITCRDEGQRMTAEIMLSWKELKLKPNRSKPIPLTILISDSDQPKRLLESKIPALKWIAWQGAFIAQK